MLETFRRHRVKIGVLFVTLLLVLWLAVTFQRGVLLLGDPSPVAKALGAGYLFLPVIGAWALIRELLFGAQTERMAKVLEAEGGLPVDDLPRTPAGRIVRAAADERFPQYQAEVENDPENWRSWFRLSCAYDAAGDRTRARKAMRDAARLFR
ncbi:tetratricopeptide repeat protein [uncultured Arthrobacter sp.]|uniref:tetratricopeptide repeat protein n=1 Tax=uncultured Arthrobacter sp. TaxID=114050 RepID=UPI0025D6FCFB|nr:tetratricopeptide repeat protein [uncultured Arthrobacter sp.]